MMVDEVHDEWDEWMNDLSTHVDLRECKSITQMWIGQVHQFFDILIDEFVVSMLCEILEVLIVELIRCPLQ